MDSTVKERLMHFIEYKGLSKNKFEEICGLSKRYVSNISVSIQPDKVKKISLKFPELNMGWVLSGEGNMINYVPTKKKIPLYDASTIGGHNDMVAKTEEPAGHVAEWIDAGDWFPEATAAMRHYGDSMIEYPSGTILVLKRVENTALLINGRNYVIETSEFRITKQLQDDGDYIMAYSSNRETYPDGRQIHAPIRIPKSAIRHIDLVLGCVLKEYSNGPVPIIRK